jgi:hypothetical protein
MLICQIAFDIPLTHQLTFLFWFSMGKSGKQFNLQHTHTHTRAAANSIWQKAPHTFMKNGTVNLHFLSTLFYQDIGNTE